MTMSALLFAATEAELDWTYKRWHVNAVLLVSTTHGEVLVNWLESVLGIPLWDGLHCVRNT